MLFVALSNAVCLYTVFVVVAIDFSKSFLLHALSWSIDTWFVYFKYDLPSFTVVLICWFFLILCSHNFSYKSAMCSGEIALKNNHYYYYIDV